MLHFVVNSIKLFIKIKIKKFKFIKAILIKKLNLLRRLNKLNCSWKCNRKVKENEGIRQFMRFSYSH